MRTSNVWWRVARGAVAVLLALATTACSIFPPTRYRSMAEAWERSAPPAADAEDPAAPLFGGGRVLDRRALVERVLERNPTVRAARYAWRAALARHPQVTALDDPMLAAGVAPASFGSRQVDDAFKIDLTQKLPFPGKLRLRGEAALAEAEAVARDHSAVRLRLATMASLLFDDHYLAARSLEINAQHIALLEEFQRIATARYESGEASLQAPIQAEVELTHALHREIVLRTTQRVTAEQINALMHRAPDAPLPPPPARIVLPAEVSEGEDLIARALRERPELAAASARVAAAERRVALARREYLPDFTLVGTYNGIHQESDLQPFVGLQMNLPLQLGRRRAALAEAEARFEVARSERLALEDETRFAVQSGLGRLIEARNVAQLFRDRLLPAAEDQVVAARSGFETGRNSFLALIDAERNLRDVELGHERALTDVARRRAELDRASGRIPGVAW